MNMRHTLEVRLAIIRDFRKLKFTLLDAEINAAEDSGIDTAALRAKRQRYRDITEPYKTLLAQEDPIELDEETSILSGGFDVFELDWN